MTIDINRSEFTFTYSRSSGAGGQNVNKVNTKATLTWNLDETNAIHNGIKQRFREKYKRFIVQENVIISSQRYRSQLKNTEDCISKLMELLNEVKSPPKRRKPTKPTRGSVKRRLDTKAKDSNKKKLRREKF